MSTSCSDELKRDLLQFVLMFCLTIWLSFSILEIWQPAHISFSFFLIQRIQPELKLMKMCTFKPKVPLKGTFFCEQTDTNVKRSARFHMPFFLNRSYLDRRWSLNGSQNVWNFLKDLELNWVSFWGFSFLLLHIRAVVFVLCGNFNKFPRTFI